MRTLEIKEAFVAMNAKEKEKEHKVFDLRLYRIVNNNRCQESDIIFIYVLSFSITLLPKKMLFWICYKQSELQLNIRHVFFDPQCS